MTSSNDRLDQKKLIETHEGRVIELTRSTSGWLSSYGLPDEEKMPEGFVYDTVEECLETTRTVIAWEVENDKIFNSFKELMQQFKADGATDAAILAGLSDAFGDVFGSESHWKKELTDQMEKASQAAKLPGRILP